MTGLGHMLNGFKRNHNIYGTVAKRNLVGGALPRVNSILVASVNANCLGNVDSGNIGSASFLKRRRAIALTARNIQYTFPLHKTGGERVTVNVLPERKQICTF